MRIAIIAITGNGAELGTRLQEKLADAEVHVLQKFMKKAGKSAIPFTGELNKLTAKLWPEVDGFVCIMSTGIVVRVVAPLLQGKDKDPAVVVMDDAGKFSISLLSGHLGGANELADRCAFLIGSQAVITTATDVNNLPSFDMLAKDSGWIIDDLSQIKALNSLFLEGEEIAIVDPTGRVRPYFNNRGKLLFCDTLVEAQESGAKGCVFVTNSYLPPETRSKGLLLLHPKNLALGIGCNKGTSAEEIEEVVTDNLKRFSLSIKSIACIASATAKREEPGLLAFAEKQDVPLSFYESVELNAVLVPSPPSAHALEAIGATGVAEPAALLSSEGGRLLLRKIKSGNVTLAIAEKVH